MIKISKCVEPELEWLDCGECDCEGLECEELDCGELGFVERKKSSKKTDGISGTKCIGIEESFEVDEKGDWTEKGKHVHEMQNI